MRARPHNCELSLPRTADTAVISRSTCSLPHIYIVQVRLPMKATTQYVGLRKASLPSLPPSAMYFQQKLISYVFTFALGNDGAGSRRGELCLGYGTLSDVNACENERERGPNTNGGGNEIITGPGYTASHSISRKVLFCFLYQILVKVMCCFLSGNPVSNQAAEQLKDQPNCLWNVQIKFTKYQD